MKRWSVLVVTGAFVLFGVTQASAMQAVSNGVTYAHMTADAGGGSNGGYTPPSARTCRTYTDEDQARTAEVMAWQAQGVTNAEIVARLRAEVEAMTPQTRTCFFTNVAVAAMGHLASFAINPESMIFADAGYGNGELESDANANMELSDNNGGSYNSGNMGPIAVGVGWADFVAASLGLGYAIGVQSTVGTVIGLVGTGTAFIGFGLAVLNALGQGGAVNGGNGGRTPDDGNSK